MYLKPCRMCHKKDECDKYQSMLKSLRGTGVTSAKFTCKEFLNFYKPGDRVSVLISERFEYCRGCDNISGTVTCVKEGNNSGKLVVYLDEEPFCDDEGNVNPSRNMFFRFWPKHVKPLDESPVKVCPYCGLPDGMENTEDFSCYACKRKQERINKQAL